MITYSILLLLFAWVNVYVSVGCYLLQRQLLAKFDGLNFKQKTYLINGNSLLQVVIWPWVLGKLRRLK